MGERKEGEEERIVCVNNIVFRRYLLFITTYRRRDSCTFWGGALFFSFLKKKKLWFFYDTTMNQFQHRQGTEKYISAITDEVINAYAEQLVLEERRRVEKNKHDILRRMKKSDTESTTERTRYRHGGGDIPVEPSHTKTLDHSGMADSKEGEAEEKVGEEREGGSSSKSRSSSSSSSVSSSSDSLSFLCFTSKTKHHKGRTIPLAVESLLAPLEILYGKTFLHAVEIARHQTDGICRYVEEERVGGEGHQQSPLESRPRRGLEPHHTISTRTYPIDGCQRTPQRQRAEKERENDHEQGCLCVEGDSSPPPPPLTPPPVSPLPVELSQASQKNMDGLPSPSRYFYRVGDYTLFTPYFCPCSAYAYQCVRRQEQVCCKHMLALRIALRVEQHYMAFIHSSLPINVSLRDVGGMKRNSLHMDDSMIVPHAHDMEDVFTSSSASAGDEVETCESRSTHLRGLPVFAERLHSCHHDCSYALPRGRRFMSGLMSFAESPSGAVAGAPDRELSVINEDANLFLIREEYVTPAVYNSWLNEALIA